MLAEVAGGVEELLRHDRRAQRRVGERRPLIRVGGAAALEVLAHRRDVEAHDLVAVDPADLAVVVRDELHRARSHAEDVAGVRVGREDGVEDLHDPRILGNEREPLVQGEADDLERRQAQRGASSRSGSAITGNGIRFRSANSTWSSSDCAERPATGTPSSG